jgi:hypothetical protein
VQFNENEFYDSLLPNQRIYVYKEDLSQPIDTLDDKETLKILNDIEQTIQHNLGGKSPSITANIDPAIPSQPIKTLLLPYI